MLRSETEGDPARRAAALAGLAAYQRAPRPERPPPPPTLARHGRARLLDYGGDGPPLLIVPSLINGPEILDLLPDLSMLRWLAGQGVRPLLLDWGSPSADERGLGIAGHVETLLLPLLRGLGEPVLLAGYCLGGTMALAAACRHPVRALALIAAPWRFAGFPEVARTGIAELWSQAGPLVERLGLLPLEVLQSGFWRLDSRRTIAKFEAFGAAPPDGLRTARFVAMEDWANGGPPLTEAAGRDLAETLFAADAPGHGAWMVGGAPVTPATLACPVLDIVSTTDRIVPAASAAGLGTRITLDLGHVGMIVGGQARARLWQPLARWLVDQAQSSAR
ncbi:alpha/beta fold hydrolase [Sphingomonas morindae]|uniref:Alpha/beta fold hydrolase n=1 Tax=Sphingomonas morindae TaxID=1541170 RepID=A0ABY4XAN3_9SPHN|nr:alpha/beta fold hydrolase [Sphingomonas morindae]USI74023.1 alpha/beta fold hydrolase [Sphingomonas morindae]